MPVIEGVIGENLGLYIELEFPRYRQVRRVKVDIGFNGEMWIPEPEAHSIVFGARWEGDFIEYEIVEPVEYAGGFIERVAVMYSRIRWFNEERRVKVFVPRGGEIMIGTKLLLDCVLTVDFPRRRLRIEKP
jgi:predicted aspartyl protease